MCEETEKRKLVLTGIGLVNLSTLTWATNITLARWIRGDIGPLTLAAGRFTIASLCYAFLLMRKPPKERRVGSDGWLLLGMGFVGVTLFSPVIYQALQHTTAVNVTLINGLGPLLTGVIAALFIAEPMSRRQAVGAVLGLIGIVVLVSRDLNIMDGNFQINPGDLVAIGSILLWSIYSVIGRRAMRNRSALSATALSTIMGLPFLLLASVWELSTRPVIFSPRLILIILYIGLVPAVIGFLAWNAGVRCLGASGAMMFYNMLPIYGVILGFFLLGEPVGWAHLFGGLLIIGGGLWAASGQRDR